MPEDEKHFRINNRKKVKDYLHRADRYNLNNFHTEIMLTDEFNDSYKVDINNHRLPEVKLDYEKRIKFQKLIK